MTARIYCFGSVNIDKCFQVPHIVRPGETLHSTQFTLQAGGKGANQSVALAKAGASVVHIGCIGPDAIWIRDLMASHGVQVHGIGVLEGEASGCAVIQVSERGENAIVLFQGTNGRVSEQHIDHALGEARAGEWVLLQNEVNAGAYLMKQAVAKEMFIAFNPAPMTPSLLQDYPMDCVHLLIVNETEAVELYRLLYPDAPPSSRIPPQRQAQTHYFTELTRLFCDRFKALLGVIVTLGAHGLIARFQTGANNEWSQYDLEAYTPGPIKDTTGAGDTSIGYFLAPLLKTWTGRFEQAHVEMALETAVIAGGLACCAPGAMSSIPTLNQVEMHRQERHEH